jgi:glycosyltransferase involved in cell wall biosynthesis
MGRRANLVVLVAAVATTDRVKRARAGAARRRLAQAERDAAVETALLEAHPPARPFVAIVMSALNEQDSIGSVLAALPRSLCGLEVRTVVVDDGSTDDTAALAREAGAAVARHRRNLGQGDGLRTGFALALELGAAVVVTMDADGQHDPAQLEDLVAPIVADRADYVQGSRFLGRYDDSGSSRHAGIKAFTALINVLAGIRITDCTNGFRAIRASGLGRMRLVEDRFSASEIIIEAAARGLRILEVPVHIRSRGAGVSKKPGGLRYPLGYLGAILRSWTRATLRRDPSRHRGRRHEPPDTGAASGDAPELTAAG